MTEQTGNNKPNEAEGLAFPLSGNEKLIEEAKHLIEQAGSFREQVGDDASPTSMIGLWLRTADALHAALAVFEKAHTPTDSKPVAYGIYGRVTGNLKYVQVMDAREVEEQSEFYDVVPLFAIPAAHGQTVGGNKREALAINYCPEHGDLLNRPGDGADARSYRCRNAHGIDEIHAGFRRSEDAKPSAGEDEFTPGECDGSGKCPAEMHVHGCYMPHRADQCDSPDEHQGTFEKLIGEEQ